MMKTCFILLFLASAALGYSQESEIEPLTKFYAAYFDDGGSYVGEISEGMMHGFGIYYYPDGSRYCGWFYENDLSNYGVLFYADGGKYAGGFLFGNISGTGIATTTEGKSYQTKYLEDVLISKNDIELQNDLQIEESIWFYENGDIYLGFKEEMYFSGTGIFSFGNGDIYIGEFAAGRYHGEGIFIKTDGTVQQGIFKEGVLESYRTITPLQ